MAGTIKRLLRERAPKAWQIARTTGKLAQLIPRVYGYERRQCPICGNRGRFLAEIHFPDIFVFDAICPTCSSNTRNRLLKLAVDRLPLVTAQSRLLHFAPEPSVTRFLQHRVAQYRTADLFAANVDYKLNIEAIAQDDESWDVIVCSHVLEHVDHRKALSELRRTLKPGGVLLALFPVVDGWETDYENPDVDAPRDRGLHFGKDNHLRRFGRSVRAEFAAAGLELETFAPVGPEIVEFGLIPGETLFIGRRN